MDVLKNYFLCSYRMSRKLFLAFLILSYLSGAVISLPNHEARSAYKPALTNLIQEKHSGKITKDEFDDQLKALQIQINNNMPVSLTKNLILSLIESLLFLPAFAMRLKDLNLNPKLSWLKLIVIIFMAASAISLGSQNTSTYMLLSKLAMFSSLILVLIEIILVIVRGTKGPNRYGSDPLTPQTVK